MDLFLKDEMPVKMIEITRIAISRAIKIMVGDDYKLLGRLGNSLERLVSGTEKTQLIKTDSGNN